MSAPTLQCECGLKLAAKGARPGRVGKCPRCGRLLKVSEDARVAPVPATSAPAVHAPSAGYHVEPARKAADDPLDDIAPPRAPGPESPFDGTPAPRPKRKKKRKAAAVERAVEPWIWPDWIFPVRGLESIVIVVCLGSALWVMAVLIPELCQTIFADAIDLGAASMGRLISLIVALPAVLIGPLVLMYWIQYLGRVLISATLGETDPPRPPDRNADGLFSGLAPWVAWSLLGASLAFAPLIAYLSTRSWRTSLQVPVILSLLRTFVHDDGYPRPFGVILGILKLNLALVPVAGYLMALGGAVRLGFGGLMELRGIHYWAYIVAGLVFWLMVPYATILAMRIVGVLYYHHRERLRWVRDRPRWGVTWGI